RGWLCALLRPRGPARRRRPPRTRRASHPPPVSRGEPKQVITGGCLCGRVCYEARGEPLFGVVCHCRDCQRASGAGHVPVIGFWKSNFSLTGETKSYAVV